MMDVQRFFPSIDHAVLESAVFDVIRSPPIRALVKVIIDGSNPQEPVLAHFPGDDLFTPLTRRRGLPIGNLTSQFFANVLLDRLDHAVVDRRRHGRYLRYCDDLAMFGDDLGALNALRAFVDDTLAGLRLKAHPRKSRVRRVDEGLTFLGFVVRRGSLRLGQVGLARFRARRRRGEAFEPASFAAWSAHVAQGTTRGLVRRLLEAEARRTTPAGGAAAEPPAVR
jgi:hypothetical protein